MFSYASQLFIADVLTVSGRSATINIISGLVDGLPVLKNFDCPVTLGAQIHMYWYLAHSPVSTSQAVLLVYQK